MKADALKDYFLVGGTSLAMQIGHRRSDDIGLFTQKEINKDEIGDYLFSNYRGETELLNSQKIIYQHSCPGNNEKRRKSLYF